MSKEFDESRMSWVGLRGSIEFFISSYCSVVVRLVVLDQYSSTPHQDGRRWSRPASGNRVWQIGYAFHPNFAEERHCQECFIVRGMEAKVEALRERENPWIILLVSSTRWQGFRQWQQPLQQFLYSHVHCLATLCFTFFNSTIQTIMSSMPPVYIVSAVRTPVGSFLGYVVDGFRSLKNFFVLFKGSWCRL